MQHGDQTSRPLLIACLGKTALLSLEQMETVENDLSLKIAGPFGVINIDFSGDTITFASPYYVAEIKQAIRDAEKQSFSRLDNIPLTSRITTLIRQIRKDVMPANNHQEPDLLPVVGYVILDMSIVGIAQKAVPVIQAIHDSYPSLDMTCLAITGRTSKQEAGKDAMWLDNLKSFVQQIQYLDTVTLQRMYIIDGENEKGTWLDNPDDIYLLAAQFIIHHGLSPYRTQIRRHEGSRIDIKENFLDYCGSFSCRTLKGELKLVADNVSKRLVDDEMSNLSKNELTTDEKTEAENRADNYTCQLIKLFSKSDKELSKELPTGDAGSDNPFIAHLRNDILTMCSNKPTAKLRMYLDRVGTGLKYVLPNIRIHRKANDYESVFAIFHEQYQKTYRPLYDYLKEGVEGWDDPNRPRLKQKSISLSSPVDTVSFYFGISFIILSILSYMACVIMHNMGQSLFIISSALAVLGNIFLICPSRWDEEKCRYRFEEDASEDDFPGYYRMDPVWNIHLSIILAIIGGALLFISVPLNSNMILFPISALIFFTAGFYLTQKREKKAKTNIEGMLNPIRWGFFVWGIACISTGIGCIFYYNFILSNQVNVIMSVSGCSLCLVGFAFSNFSLTGKISLIKKISHPPDRIPPDINPKTKEAYIFRNAFSLMQWIQTLLNRTEKKTTQSFLEWPEKANPGSIFEAFVKDWDSQVLSLYFKDLSEQNESFQSRIHNPDLWAKYIISDIKNNQTNLSSLEYIFVRYSLNEWLQKQSVDHILNQISIDEQWFNTFVTKDACCHWPKTRNEPEVDVSVVAVSQDFWEKLSYLNNSLQFPNQIIKIDWPDPKSIIIFRIVQGLRNGWLGISPL
jgi:hypothetical protein